MKLYHFADPENYDFAQASRLGTWHPESSKLCPECNTSRQKRVPPLILEWEPGSNKVGDFIWPGFNTELVVTQRVKDDLEKSFREMAFATVEFWENPKLKKPNKANRSKSRVWLPYTGPTLWDVIPTKWCRLDHDKSGVAISKECGTCGKTIYRTPPWSRRHLVIDPATWAGEDIFHIYEYSGAIFCTERVKEFVEQSEFTNVSFLEDGEIPT